MDIKLIEVNLRKGYSIIAVSCNECDMPAELFSDNGKPLCGKHAQQSVHQTKSRWAQFWDKLSAAFRR